jgi:hypothetical protein
VTSLRSPLECSILRSTPQDAGTPSNSTHHTCHLGGHPSKYKLGPMLAQNGDQMGTGMSNVARRRSQTTVI